MITSRIIAFAFALAAWLVYFYLVDTLIMEAQGLHVGWNLMPAS